MINSKIPAGEMAQKWIKYKDTCKLVNPANKRSLEIIVIGTGLAGASAAASLGEMGYKVKAFCFRIPPAVRTLSRRRAVSTQLRIIRMTATLRSVFFMIRSKAATTGQGKQTFTVLPR